VRSNKPPVVKIDGEKTRAAKVGQPLDLSAVVTDDGIPKRRGSGSGAAVSSGAARPAADPAAAAAVAAQRIQRAMMSPPPVSPSARTSGCTFRGSPTAVQAR